MADQDRYPPGRVRDAILRVLGDRPAGLPVRDIERQVRDTIGPTPPSSVRSYLRLNTPTLFSRESRGVYRLSEVPSADIGVDTGEGQSFESCRFGNAEIIFADCFDWLAAREDCSIHAIVTDPPYGLHEYTREQQDKLRTGKGGVWRIPPSFDGHRRSPLPRFTTLTDEQISHLGRFFYRWARLLAPKLVPGANVLVASNPLVSHIVSSSLAEAGLERRGEIIRLVMTMRGGDRPKTAHEEFPEVSVMPRSMWEPWLVFRRPLEGTARDNLRQWGTGGFRRPAAGKPFGDVIKSAPTQPNERRLAPHPSLKPQAFLRQIVRASLPLGRGVVVDPFAGAGSTLAAAECVGYPSIGVENDEHYFRMACRSIPALARFRVRAGS